MDNQNQLTEVHNQLREYQKDVAKTMIQQRKHLNYLDMGLGKSLVTSFSIIYAQAFPCIIVCTKSAMYVWEQELMKWFGQESVVYVGKPKQREERWQEFIRKGCNFIITNYALAEELAARFGVIESTKTKGPKPSGTNAKALTTPGTWKMAIGGVIADEIQLGGLFNHKTKAYGIFQKLTKVVPYMYLLTGTPYRRGCIDFYGPLSLVAPERFDSYWKYVAKHCTTIDTGFGKGIERNPKDIVEFRALLREHASILKKTDYLHELPGKIRQVIPLELEDEQLRVYDELTKDLYTETDTGELILTPSILSLMVRHRQLLVAPQELGLKARGVAIDTLIEMAGDLVEDRKPFVVFTPFKKAVPWIAAALKEAYGGIRIFEITGGLTPEQFRDQWQGFQDGAGRRVLICVIKSGASFHATCADTAFFLGYEWDFNQNEQAEDRLNRMGQKSLVTCYYLLHKGTIDDHVVQRLNEKKYGAELILTEEEAFQKMMAKREE